MNLPAVAAAWDRAGRYGYASATVARHHIVVQRNSATVEVRIRRDNAAPAAGQVNAILEQLGAPANPQRRADGPHTIVVTWPAGAPPAVPTPPQPPLPAGQPDLFSAAESSEPADTAERFARFHAAHPEVYAAIRAEALFRRARGDTRIGIKAIFEELRPRFAGNGNGNAAAYGLDNRFTSRYSRLLTDEYPELAELIHQKALTA